MTTKIQMMIQLNVTMVTWGVLWKHFQQGAVGSICVTPDRTGRNLFFFFIWLGKYTVLMVGEHLADNIEKKY